MSERRRCVTTHQVDHITPIIEERRPEGFDDTIESRRRSRAAKSTQVHKRRKEPTERFPSPVQDNRRPRAPTPPPIFDSLPLSPTMSPKETSASKAFMPKALPLKKEDAKSKNDAKSSDKSKEKPRVKVYERGHRHQNSYDTGYASGLSSPWSIEERSPLDYSPTPKSPKPRVDKEPYEIIVGSGKPNYAKYSNSRKKDHPAVTERKSDVRYVNRTPESPDYEDEYVPGPPGNSSKLANVRKTARVLQEKVEQGAGTKTPKYEAARREEAQRLKQIETLQAELGKTRLERQLAEGRAAEAERKLKQQQIDELERREKELRQQQAEEQKKREEEILRREVELAEKQWKEIQEAPSPVLQRRPAALVEQEKKPRRNSLMAPYGASALTTTFQSPSVLATDSLFFAPIFEAQRDEDARRARESKNERRRGTEVKETSRSAGQRPRRGDRHT